MKTSITYSSSGTYIHIVVAVLAQRTVLVLWCVCCGICHPPKRYYGYYYLVRQMQSRASLPSNLLPYLVRAVAGRQVEVFFVLCAIWHDSRVFRARFRWVGGLVARSFLRDLAITIYNHTHTEHIHSRSGNELSVVRRAIGRPQNAGYTRESARNVMATLAQNPQTECDVCCVWNICIFRRLITIIMLGGRIAVLNLMKISVAVACRWMFLG